uniref:Neurotransmitter-gated ion-channel ligand-binding domain-containing protein n=1 Tax=Romanomermis culicivorax TaxID=13658 RepID=A0A915IQS7_ROMCU
MVVLLIFWPLVLCGPMEKLIISKVMSNYSNLVRPVKNDLTDAVVINLGIDVQQLVDINEKDQFMQANLWLRFVSEYIATFCIKRRKVLHNERPCFHQKI